MRKAFPNASPCRPYVLGIRALGRHVIDGYPTQRAGNGLMINPHDIKHIEVLNDVDARALYGSRATNGVVLITTK